MKINRLYTSPAIIDPIEFSNGLNIIMGEKNHTNAKENSVGKSLCIEFINFALLADEAKSRIKLVPDEVLPKATEICIDFEINGTDFTIKRSIEEPTKPAILENGITTTFRKLEDAKKYLEEKLFAGTLDRHPSYRAMLGPIIRDERSEFKSLIDCYNTKLRIPADYSPHLYLLGIDIELYEEIKRRIKDIESIANNIKEIEKSLETVTGKCFAEASATFNELNNEVHSIEESINLLENISAMKL